MKLELKIKNFILIVSLILFAWSCETTSNEYEEVPLDVSGNWEIVKVSRNGVEITSLMDFTQFKLNLNNDGSYSIDNYLPFVVKERSGRWEVDDPNYPFRLFFYDNNGANKITSSFYYPPVGGVRQLSLTFPTGCYSNTYTYVFKRVTTKY